MLKLSNLITEFLEHLEIERNRSQKTVRNYDFYLQRFIGWFGDKQPGAITGEDVRKYRLWLNRLVDVHGDPLKKKYPKLSPDRSAFFFKVFIQT